MRLTPLGGDPLRDVIPVRTGGGAPAPTAPGTLATDSAVAGTPEPAPEDTWSLSTTPSEGPALSDADAPSTPPGRIHGEPLPSPSGTPAPSGPLSLQGNSPALLVDGDLLSRPLTLEELATGRLLESSGSEQPPVGSATAPVAGMPSAAPALEAPRAIAPASASAPEAPRKIDAASLPHLLPPKDGQGLAGTAAATAVRAARRLGNVFMSIVGKGDDTLDMTPALDQINALGPQMKAMSDAELKGMTNVFRQRLAAGETLDSMLPEAFAVVREAADRSMGMRPFDVQVLGGIAMHEGKISEMGTGEGKTLTATLPVYLNALSGKGVHVVTVNDTLAKRDCANMSRVYNWLGLTSGTVAEGMSPEEKRQGYNADITYVTNTTLGFDYLRDNMARSPEDRCQRTPNFALIDEVDEILIDEARTPLIISQLSQPSTGEYQTFANIVKDLVPGQDFKVNLK